MKKTNTIRFEEDFAVIEIQNNFLGKLECLIDIEDIDKVKDLYWNVRYDKRHPNCTVYVESRINRKRVHLHRFLVNPPADKVIDHINGNGLDNRKCNLRICTQSENSLNRHITNKGIYYNKRDNLWIAYIVIHKKTKYLGYYRNEFEAVARRNQINKLIEKGLLKNILTLKCEKVSRIKEVA